MAEGASLQELRSWFLFSYDRRRSRAEKACWLASGRSVQRYLLEFGVPSLATTEEIVWQQTCEFAALDAHYCLTPESISYPHLLKHIGDPPHILYVIGNLALFEEPSFAVVGSRRPSELGKRAIDQLVGPLAELGIVITSGMALGIDAAAHQKALQHQAPTIAVMPCGADFIYPARHRALYDQIIDHGLIVSE